MIIENLDTNVNICFENLFALALVQVIPCAVVALLSHPSTRHHIVNRLLWAFCVYLEAVSVLPQLRVMQNTKVLFQFCSIK